MLQQLTDEFFGRHWADELGSPPVWTAPWPVNGQGPIPDGDKQGCYALYRELDLLYVGLGVSRGAGLYQGHGIGNRLYKHVLRINSSKGVLNGKGFYMPHSKWADITHLRTIGFHAGSSYLAPALELYLLNRFPPAMTSRNSQRPGSAT